MEKKVRTVCFDCHSKCGVILTVNDNDEIVRVEGDKNNPVNDGILCVKAFSAQEIHAHPDRLKYPLKRAGKRGEGKWKAITWDDLIKEVTEGGKLFAWFGCLFWLIVWVIMVVTGGIATFLAFLF